MSSKRSLKELLSIDERYLDEEMSGPDSPALDKHKQGQDPNLCVECGDQPRELLCVDCDEPFCNVCFQYLHRTGKRRDHERRNVVLASAASQESERMVSKENDSEPEDEEPEAATLRQAALSKFRSNTQYIPLRLTAKERKYFRLLEAALNVSEYTDKVDILTYTSKVKRIVNQLKEMCTVLTGLVVANGMEEGKALLEDKDFVTNAEWFQAVFEIGRRYKIMNPESMRNTFGKLMYMIMDSCLPQVQSSLEFDLYKPINTVHSFLNEREAVLLLDDDLVFTATMEISSRGRPRSKIQSDIRAKEQAIDRLARTYRSKLISSDDIRQVLYSIGDYHAYLAANRTPVTNMIRLLEDNFQKDEFEKGFSLGISAGSGGARLSHNHTKQYQYVLQSLTLWSEVMRNMYMLWKLADDDMTSSSFEYRLTDTGQGLNRVKPCPSVGRAMHNIIHQAQKQTGSWIGSSVVHLGDNTVPNALFFLDKYLQVPRILNPVNLVLLHLPTVFRDPYAQAWSDAQFGSLQLLEKHILTDFFRHAFDGSGADNFYDAGSCIDGRLTSAWNWANSISKKDYYKQFLVCGFVGFDGSEGF